MVQNTTRREPGSRTQSNEISLPKYPAYGKVLADRKKWGNPPMFIFVCVGGGAFRSAQNHNKDRDMSAMVLTPGQDPAAMYWPVAGCPVVIESDGSAPRKVIIELINCLRRSGATSVTVWPTYEDFSTPLGYYDCTQSPPVWIQTRETINTYFQKAVKNVSA